MNQEQMIERWLPEIEMNGKDYLKKGTVFARPAKIGEKIITITSDGKETENTAGENCFVVKNPTGEERVKNRSVVLFSFRSFLNFFVLKK